MNRLNHTVTVDEEGYCVRDIIQRYFDISKRFLKKCKQDQEGIFVNGQRRTVRFEVHQGDVVSIALIPKEQESDILHEAGPLDIVYEDTDILVVDKPPHMMMYPRFKGERGSLAGRVLHYLAEKGERAIYHPLTRLDIGTSGLVLLAKSSYATYKLNEHRPEKYYQCIAFGKIEKNMAIDLPLTECPQPLRALTGALQCVSASGKPSRTLVWPLFYDEKRYMTGLWVQIETGRRHQIRVHLAHQGHPLIGDVAYGGPAQPHGHPLLHAAALYYQHPISGVEMSHFLPLHAYNDNFSFLHQSFNVNDAEMMRKEKRHAY